MFTLVTLLVHMLLSKNLARRKRVSVSGKNEIISIVSARAEKKNYIRETKNV